VCWRRGHRSVCRGKPGRRSEADGKNRVEMSLVLQMASLYLIEFAKHLLADDEPFDALLKTA
jgi:hypothetical protein